MHLEDSLRRTEQNSLNRELYTLSMHSLVNMILWAGWSLLGVARPRAYYSCLCPVQQGDKLNYLPNFR